MLIKDYRSILDGSRRDLTAVVLRPLLSLVSVGYGTIVRLRNRRYEKKLSEIHSVGIPVISVGNLTAGGTGKTPMVAAIAGHLRSRGVKVAIVSRGYRSDQSGMNDEARELHDRLPDVPHVQDADRVAACRVAIDELEMEVVLLDDGFQHRRLHRDLNILLIDATCPFGFGRLLPRGLLREPTSAISRADFVVVTRVDKVSDEVRRDILREIRNHAPQVAVAECEYRPVRLLGDGAQIALSEACGRHAVAFAGIGNPAPFFHSVEQLGVKLVGTRTFPDHHDYDSNSVRELIAWINGQRNEYPDLMAICTHKDLVKLRTETLGGVPLWALQVETHVVVGADEFWRVIDLAADNRVVAKGTSDSNA